MDRQEYIKRRFRENFLKYCPLQADSASADDIAGRISTEFDLNGLISSLKDEIAALCDSSLSFDKMKIEGRLSNTLPDGYRLENSDEIVEKYAHVVEGQLTRELSEKIIGRLLHAMEKSAWSNGVTAMAAAVDALIARMSAAARSY
ncbi:MAG: hypothetical protein NC115_10555 [Bacteroidales bacterium]|nr:hypothetical protein [Bacteroides sp.]MCM1198784.1 hypothetical protein [Clostridium sp.]MCM1503087.1 hypothetical protein [Bacteroidales bacterium]